MKNNTISPNGNILAATLRIYSNPDPGSEYVARQIADVIKEKQSRGQKTILGLATGATPKGVYRNLINLHQNEGLSFRDVITFNLDEYYPIEPTHELSYVTFMHEQLFNHIDMAPENIHIPCGTLKRDEIEGYCNVYEQKIRDLGGLDIQLLGIGRTGHLGFNEPGSVPESLTRLVDLNEITRNDAIDDFGGIENVPVQAITLGLKAILNAKKIFLVAWGDRKAEIVQKALEGTVSSDVPASFLQSLPTVEYILDQNSAALLSKVG